MTSSWTARRSGRWSRRLAIVCWIVWQRRNGRASVLRSASSAAATLAADKCRLGDLKWWLESYYDGRELNEYDTIFELATVRGHLDILKWLKDRGKLPKGNARSRGVRCSDPEVIQWLHAQGTKVSLVVSVGRAASHRNTTCMAWLHEHRRAFKKMGGWSWAGFLAAYSGNFEMVQWFHENRPRDFTIGVVKGAITGGHLDIAKWAIVRKPQA